MRRYLLITGLLIGFCVLTFSQAIDTITVQWGNLYFTYDGNPHTPTPTATDSLGQDVPLMISGMTGEINAGGPFHVYVYAMGPYYLIDSDTDYYIGRLELPVQWGDSLFTYNGSLQVPTVTTIPGVFGENLPITPSVHTGDGTNAGSHLAQVNFTPPQNNYMLPEIPFPYTIAPATLAVQWGNTSLTWNGFPQAPTATTTDIFGAPVPLTILGQQINVYSGYVATAIFSTADPNYVLGNATTTFSINLPSNPLVFLIRWNNLNLTYDGYPQAPSAYAVNYLGANLRLAITGEQTNAGTGYIAIASNDDPNIIDPVLINNTTAFEISPANVNVEWGDTSMPYTGKPQAPTATVTGVLDEDLPLTIRGMQTDLGTGYTASATFRNSEINYSLNNTTIKFEITPAPITVQWGKTILTYNGNPQAPTATALDIFGSNLPLTVTGAMTDVGAGYLATASQTYANKYYALVNPTTLFDIESEPVIVKPIKIAIQWGDRSLTYNGHPQAPTATATGADGEELPLTVTGEQTVVGKEYKATASLISPSIDYELDDTTTLFEITPALITVQWGDKSFAYNGNPQAPTANATGVIGDNLPVDVTGEQINAGKGYLATASVNTVNNNYTFGNLTTLFDITQENLNITAISVTIDEGQTPELDYTITSGQLFGSNTLTGSLSVEMSDGTPLDPPYPAGIYSIVQGTLTAGSNYLIGFTEGTLTVFSLSTEIIVLVNDKLTKRKGDIFYADPAENGEDQAIVNVISNIFDTITINGKNQNPNIVDLSKYGENQFIITIKAQNGNTYDYTLVIERYYDFVVYEYPDVPTINCNPLTNGGFKFTGFQWYREGEVIPDATRSYYQIKDNATYHCELTSDDGVKFRTINILPQTSRSSGAMRAYPNPTQGKVTILQSVNAGDSQNKSSGQMKIQVYDVNGVLVMQSETNPFDMSVLPEGIYFIKVNGISVKIIKVN